MRECQVQWSTFRLCHERRVEVEEVGKKVRWLMVGEKQAGLVFMACGFFGVDLLTRFTLFLEVEVLVSCVIDDRFGCR